MADDLKKVLEEEGKRRKDFSGQVKQTIDAVFDDELVSAGRVGYSTNRITVDIDASEVGAKLNEHDDFDGLQVTTTTTGKIRITESTITDGGQETNVFKRNVRQITDRIGRFLIWGPFSSESVTRPDKDSTSRSDITALEAERTFLDQFGSSTMKWSGLGVVLPICLLVLDVFLCGAIPNLVFGVWMEVVGAFALATGVLMDPVTMRDVSTSRYGGPSPIHRQSLAMDAADGGWGIFLVVIGTIWQSLAATGFVLFSGCI